MVFVLHKFDCNRKRRIGSKAMYDNGTERKPFPKNYSPEKYKEICLLKKSKQMTFDRCTLKRSFMGIKSIKITIILSSLKPLISS